MKQFHFYPDARSVQSGLALVQHSIPYFIVFFLVFFLHSYWIKEYATNSPFWDEWVNLDLLYSYQEGTLTFKQLFAMHNEHCILIARLVFLFLFEIYGYFDLFSNDLFSGAINGLIICLWVFNLRRMKLPLWSILISSVILVSPVQWENILTGFQVQFYTLILSSLATVSIITHSRKVTWPVIYLIILCCFVATFSIASGLFTWGIAIILFSLREHLTVRYSSFTRSEGFISKMIVLSLAGSGHWWFYLSAFTANKTPSQINPAWFAAYLVSPLAAPDSSIILLSTVLCVIWVPILLAICSGIFKSTFQQPESTLLLVGLSLFIILNMSAMGYARSDTLFISPRYKSITLWSSAICIISFALLLQYFSTIIRADFRISSARFFIGKALLFTIILLTGFLIALHAHHFHLSVTEMKMTKVFRDHKALPVSLFLSDPSPNRKLGGDLPFPSKEYLYSLLNHPQKPSLLPAHLRTSNVNSITWDRQGNAWTIGGVWPYTKPEIRRGEWGSWSGSDANKGTITSAAILVEKSVLEIPIAGYPGLPGTSLFLQDVDHPETRLFYTGPPPKEEWQTWQIRSVSLIGKKVRIVAIDDSEKYWLGVGNVTQLNLAAWLQHLYLNNLFIIILFGGIVFFSAYLFRYYLSNPSENA